MALKALAPSIDKNCTEDERLKRQTQLDKSTAWMDTALRENTFEALSTDWILDCDTTVKLLFGHQDGAEIGYNPSKPGRPSHNIHTYLDTILATAPQLTKRERWTALVRYIVEKIIATKPKNDVQPALMPSTFSQPLIPATG
jgi:hypothetical protein